MLAGLFGEQFDVVSRRQTDQPNLSGKSSATLMVLVPMEPVLNRVEQRFSSAMRFRIARAANRDT